jgi:hypothetical protein
MNRDIKAPWLIHTKAALFGVAGLTAATMLVIQSPTLQTAALLLVAIWAFCRLYYYLFYVLDRYLGREKRFAGVIDAVRYLCSKERRPEALRPPSA